MFNKADQARRAAEFSAKMIAAGLSAPPVLTIPKPKPAPSFPASQKLPPKVSHSRFVDCAGNSLSIGDKVATTIGERLANLFVGEVIGFSEKKVRLRIQGTERTKFPEQLAKVS